MCKQIDIKELRSIQLNILDHVDTFCKEHNIRYFLCGGTMLGAVRHKGYIPWDDDIDIMMLRDEYDKFIQLYYEIDKSEFHIHHYTFERYFPYSFAKIDNSNTTFIENMAGKTTPIGVNIDIFPIDVVPEDISKQKWMFRRFEFLQTIMELKQVQPIKGRVWYKNLILHISHILLRPVPIHFIVKLLNKNATRYNNQSSKYCAIAVWGYGRREMNLRSNWDDFILMPFEKQAFPVPIGYDKYLSCVYGDYMKLPSEEKRVSTHDFTAYWKYAINEHKYDA